MDFFFNSPLNLLTNDFGTNLPLSNSIIPPAVRGSPVPVRFRPFTGTGSTALPFALPASFDLRLTAKLASESGDDPTAILSASGFLYDPVTGIYSGLLDTGTVQVVQAFVGASLVNAQTASFAPGATDVTKLITVATAGASNITLPLDATIAPGTPAPKLWLMATGAGPVTVQVAATMNALVLSGLTTAVLTPGVPVMATKTAANTWTLSVPPEVASINLNAEWSYADVTVTPLRYQRIPAFVLQVANWIFNGGEGSPANTGDPSAYALAATVAAEVTRATGAEAALGTAITTAVGAEATARTNAINTAVSTEATNRANAITAAVTGLAIAPLKAVQSTAGTALANSIADHDATASLVIPAGALSVGDVIECDLAGLVTNGTGACNLLTYLKVAGVKSTPIAQALGTVAGTNSPFVVRFRLYVKAIGSLGSLVLTQEQVFRSLATGVVSGIAQASVGQAFAPDTTASITITLGCSLSLATAALSTTVVSASIIRR